MDLKEKNIVDVGFVSRLSELPATDLPLTNREKEIMVLLAQGQTNKQISKILMLSPSTIRNHISSIFTKLKIANRSQATAIAIYAGLLNQKIDNNQEAAS